MAPTGDRLSALDAAFLQLEDGRAHMHVGAVLVFDGPAPSFDELADVVERRLHRVPRFRQRVAWPPGKLARPQWIDDERFDLRLHLRHAGLPRPGGERELRALAAQLFGEPLDTDRPLWELWLVDGLADGRFAIVNKTHHALVDGIAATQIAALMLDLEPEPAEADEAAPEWSAAPRPSAAQLLAGGITEQVRGAASAVRGLLDVLRDGERAAEALTRTLRGAASIAAPARPTPPCAYNVPIGAGRRYTWVECPLDEVRAVRRVLGGTLNDIVLSAVAGALRRHLLRRGDDPEMLRAMVPVSVREPGPAGELGNRVTSLFGELPVGLDCALARLAEVRATMGDLKASDQGEGGQALVAASDLAPPSLLGVGARRLASPRLFNLTVTNIPGPQVPLYLLGREMVGLHPIVPLAPDHALGVAILSYNGRLSFGLLGDFDALWDLDDLADDVGAAVDELLDAVGRPAFDGEGVRLLPR